MPPLRLLPPAAALRHPGLVRRGLLARVARALGVSFVPAVPALVACHHAPPPIAPTPPTPTPRVATALAPPDFLARERSAWVYAGVDTRGVPRYSLRAYTTEERRVLRNAYGVEDPNRLYLADSSGTRVLKYDTRPKPCRTCYVNSYRIGFVSVRRPSESWDAVEERVRHTRARDLGARRQPAGGQSASLAALDPDIQPLVTRFLDDARGAGFRLRVTSTYRSPEREAMVMATSIGATHTLTSLHSYGRAFDVDVLDARGHRVAPRPQWVAFRRWAVAYPGHAFRILGTPAQTWDWRHVELPGPEGFRSVDDAIIRARACSAATPNAATPNSAASNVVTVAAATRPTCDFTPHLRSATAATPALTSTAATR